MWVKIGETNGSKFMPIGTINYLTFPYFLCTTFELPIFIIVYLGAIPYVSFRLCRRYGK